MVNKMLLIGGVVLVGAAFLFKDQIMAMLSGGGGAAAGGGGLDITEQIAQYIGGLSPAMKDCVKQKCQRCLKPGGEYCSDCAAKECGFVNPFMPKSGYTRVSIA